MRNQIPKILLLICVLILSASAQNKPKFVCESDFPSSDRDFSDWIRDVKWIISYEEEDRFARLKSQDEKLRFIEQFWGRRDPDPETKENEFRQEYCKRIQDSEKFRSGIPGWKTDRGRVYVLFGKPSKILNGRGDFEGLRNILFEKWTIDYVQGLGPDLQVTFIDPTETNEFRIVSTDRERMMKIFEAGKHGLSTHIGPDVKISER